MTFTNVDLLIEVTRGRPGSPVRSSAARACSPLAGALRRAGPAAQEHARPVGQRDRRPRDRRLGLDAGDRRQADAARRRAGRGAEVPRQGAAAGEGRAGRLRRRAPGRRPADHRPRASSGRGSTPSTASAGSAAPRSATRSPRPSTWSSPRRPRACRRSPTPSRRLRRRRARSTILFLSDGHQTRGLLQPLEGAARAKAAGIPVFTIALGTPNGVLDRGAGRGGGGGGSRRPVRRLRLRAAHPGAAGSRHAAGDRPDDRREVLRGALREGGRVGLLEPGLDRRPRAGEARGDVVVRGAWRRSCSSPRRCSRRSSRRACRRSLLIGEPNARRLARASPRRGDGGANAAVAPKAAGRVCRQSLGAEEFLFSFRIFPPRLASP